MRSEAGRAVVRAVRCLIGVVAMLAAAGTPLYAQTDPIGLDLGDLLDDAHQVALAEDALGHAFGLKFLQRFQLLADADDEAGEGEDQQRRG